MRQESTKRWHYIHREELNIKFASIFISATSVHRTSDNTAWYYEFISVILIIRLWVRERERERERERDGDRQTDRQTQYEQPHAIFVLAVLLNVDGSRRLTRAIAARIHTKVDVDKVSDQNI